jgi:hypothetical protein
MTKPVKLGDLTGALDYPEDWGAWLDRETGEVIVLDPETIRAGEDDGADEAGESDGFEDAGGAGLIDPQALAVSLAVAKMDPRYLALPDKFDFHEYRHMERWIAGIAEPGVAEQLWDAIKGKGAFRHFKDTARRLGLLEDWFAHRQRALERHMLDWAEANGVPVERATTGESRGPA